jgi:hypothetical protein
MSDRSTEFTLDERNAMSQAFDAGNYANAYETRSLATAWRSFGRQHGYMHRECTRAAFVLGFFGSYELHEMVGADRRHFDLAYHSAAGRYVVEVAKYTDSRSDEYVAESEAR